MSAAPAMQPETPSGPQQQYLDVLGREHATTVKVLRAYPADKADLRPHSKCKTARELAWTFVMEQGLALRAITTGLDWSQPPSARQEPPSSMEAVVQAFEAAHRDLVEAVKTMPEEKLSGSVKFFTAPKTLGDVPTMQFLWMLLFDQIHHRGQFSVYLRMADGRLPSIYGPTADEPWM